MHIPKPPIQKPEDKAKYYAYLRSSKWKQKRNLVFEREGGICQGCLEEPIEHVHHLNYSHLFDELLFELVGLCETCHRRTHWLNPHDVGHEIEY
jgi:5-methylcytosine-specific restriction endonuclease McrA